MRAGHRNKWVTLARSKRSDGEAIWTALSPAGEWAAIQPLPPGGADGRSTLHQIEMRYHAGVTIDTRIQYVDARLSRTRDFYVRGVQSVNEAGDSLILFAEEVQP
jgi:head-tail adaptor